MTPNVLNVLNASLVLMDLSFNQAIHLFLPQDLKETWIIACIELQSICTLQTIRSKAFFLRHACYYCLKVVQAFKDLKLGCSTLCMLDVPPCVLRLSLEVMYNSP